jgi:hypothetical protein
MVERLQRRGERLLRTRDEQENSKVKSPRRKIDVWAPKFVFEFIVRATRQDERAGRGETKGRTAHPPQIFYNPGATSFFS